MHTTKEIHGMLVRFVDAVEGVRKLQKQYEKDAEASTMVKMNDAENKLDEMVFGFRIWNRKNEKFFE